MPSRPLNSVRPPRWSHWPAAGVLIVGCAATLVLCFWLRGKAREADRARLHEEAVLEMETIETRIELCVETLSHLAEQASRATNLDLANWNKLVYDAKLRDKYPGLSAVGFWSYQPATNRPAAWLSAWLSTWSALELPPPLHAGPLAEDRLIRAFHSPVDQTRVGYHTEASGQQFEPDLALQGKISWTVGVGSGAMPGQEVFDGRSQVKDRGFRVLLPVFAPQRPPRELIRERYAKSQVQPQCDADYLVHQNDWANLMGILYGEFAMKHFVTSTLGNRARSLEFTISDADGGWRSETNAVLTPIYGEAVPSRTRPYLEERLEMKHYGRRLIFDFRTTPMFDAHSLRRWPLLAGFIGGSITLLMAGIVFGQTQARARQDADAQRLRGANEQLEAALRDRERISRELHDGALQSIYAVGLGLTHCRKVLSTQPERAQALLSETTESLNAVVAELRQFLLTLEADVIQGGSVEPVLRAIARRVEATTSARVAVEIDSAAAGTLSANQSLHVVSLVREAISNSFRHGDPSEVSIGLSARNGGWRLEIRDNGCGFDPARIDTTSGHGLRNMRARAAELGGSFALESEPGSGTLVRVECDQKKA